MIKTKNMRKTLEPVIAQASQLKEMLTADNTKVPSFGALQSLMLSQMQTLVTQFDSIDQDLAEDYKELKREAVKIMNNFCSTNFDTKSEQNHSSYKTKIDNMLEKFTNSLKCLEELECTPLKQALQECLDYVQEMGSVDEIEDFQNIKELGTFILDTFGPLQVYRKGLSSHLLSERIALYSRQLYVSFSLLVQLVQEQHELKSSIYSSKKYICDRMCQCFRMIIHTIEAPNPTDDEENFEATNHFVYRMDLVLDVLSELVEVSFQEKLDRCPELWLRIEDVFSHAMSIAQVCEPLNFDAITGISQTIISEYEKLKQQLQVEPPDSMYVNLFINTLKDALYRLEHRINVSMLTMVMSTFSDPFSSLKQLIKSCGIAIEPEKRSCDDLKDAVEEFDQTTDKIMQIGLFAVACCKNDDRVNRLRSCLASFESMDTELVPAVTSFYLNPTNAELRTSLKLLSEEWQKELGVFQRTIYLIIDSAAYCQVILDDLQERTMKMHNSLDNLEGVTQSQVDAVVMRALSLTKQISAMIDDVGRENIEYKTIKLNQELKAAIYEANVASKMLLQESAPEAQQLRVIKRCELILNVIKKLQPDLNIIMNTSTISSAQSVIKNSLQQNNNFSLNNASLHSNIYELPFDQKTVSYIRTPYTVKSCKTTLSLQPANSVAKSPAKMSSLIPYIKKGKSMRTEHSIMYKTPVKLENQKENKKTRDLSSIRQHLFSRDNFHQDNEISLNVESIDLTCILDKVTTLCDTLSSEIHTATKEADPSKSKAL